MMPEAQVAEGSLLRRRFRGRRRRLQSPIDAVAFLNVVLLLGFFLFTKSAFIVRPGIRVELPVAPFVDGEPYDSLVVTVSHEGMIFFGDTRMQLEDLREALTRARSRTHGDRLVIEADRRVPYDTILRIHGLATEAGISRVLLATRLPPESTIEPAKP